MGGPFDRPDIQSSSGIAAGPDWFSLGQDLSAINGPPNKVVPIALHESPPDLSPAADTAEIKQALETQPAHFDFTSLLADQKRVVFFGERHDDLSQKDEIIKNLKALKEKDGLSDVALEMLNDNDMPSVKSYFQGTGSRQAVLDRLKERWSIAPGVPEKYMDLIDAIKEARLNPLALDQALDGRDDTYGTLFEDRNGHWASVIKTALDANPNNKVLVYSGRDHVGYGPDHNHANEILQSEYGQQSQVVVFTSQLDNSQSLPGKVNKIAVQKGLRESEFVLDLDQSIATRPGDIILHQPN